MNISPLKGPYNSLGMTWTLCVFKNDRLLKLLYAGLLANLRPNQPIVCWTWSVCPKNRCCQTIVGFWTWTKNYSTQYSRVVPHHSTDCAITSLTSEIRRDPVLSGVYGRSYYDCTKKPENLKSLSPCLFCWVPLLDMFLTLCDNTFALFQPG